MPDHTLTNFIRFGQSVDQFQSILEFAIQFLLARACQLTLGIDRFGISFGQTFLRSIASEVIVDLEGISQGIHLLVTTPAFNALRLLQPFSQRFRMVFRNRGIHGDGNIRNHASQ